MNIQVDEQALKAALIELQAASWARSWARVKRARREISRLIGIDVPGPLTAAVAEAKGGA
jgi:hypothetical protein